MNVTIELRGFPDGGIRATILESPLKTAFGHNVLDAMKSLAPLIDEYVNEWTVAQSQIKKSLPQQKLVGFP